MAFEAVNLKDHIGTEIRTDKKSLLTPEIAQKVRQLLIQRGVLVFKELQLSDEEQLQLSRLMGTLREEGEKGIFKVTLDRTANARADYLKGSFLWHIDGTHDTVPVFASLLSARKLSATGGQTEFANSYIAYDELSEAMKKKIAGLRVLHSVEVSMLRADIEPTPSNLADWRRLPDKTHNLVWTHKSGRKSLVIGCHAASVEGMEQAEGEQLIAELLAWTTQPKFMYRHEWSPGDMLIWDNTGVLHRAEPYPLDSGRMMHRTTLMGEEGFA
ncbi:TauD/TfdA dioxygenase family protein [Stenotrophobium rhamnosiphilum]|uniref:Taurine catabolism dioxygenase n=1 Tax=Stenotrophobium rhamnosiphilum TaxID=2029166 RepID=A0A2T5MH50_9GAMM|nr:TauD/TfdA family dioxygenase [Stenotrophobium rhamnosiphilum]PTU31890.1 taurine catabolism dioxygenase [Stenotrophobium rhamnosiphilum]